MQKAMSCRYCKEAVSLPEIDDHQLICCGSATTYSPPSQSKLSTTLSISDPHLQCFFQSADFMSHLSVEIERSLNGQFPDKNIEFVIKSSSDICVKGCQDRKLIEKSVHSIINEFTIIFLPLTKHQMDNLLIEHDLYGIDLTHKGANILCKKQSQLEIVRRIYEGLLANIEARTKPCKIHTAILEFEEQIHKQINDIIKSMEIFVPEFESVAIKTKNYGSQRIVVISGNEQQVKDCTEFINSVVHKQTIQTNTRAYKISKPELEIIEKYELLEKAKEKYGIKYEISNFLSSYFARINEKSVVDIYSNPSILNLPKQSAIIVSQELMKEIRQIQESVPLLKDYFFYSASEENGTVQEALREFLRDFVHSESKISLILPQNNKESFILDIISIIRDSQKEISLYLLERKNSRLAVESLKTGLSKQRSWYITKNGVKLPYHSKANKQIEQAFRNGVEKLILTHQQLGVKKTTHRIGLQGTLVHLKTGIEHIYDQSENSLIVLLKQDTFIAEVDQVNQNNVMLIVEEIDFLNMKQVSLVSGKVYDIGCDYVEKQEEIEEMETHFDVIIKYPDADTIENIWKEVKAQIFNKRIVKIIPIEGIRSEKIEDLMKWGRINKINLNLNQDNTLVAISFSEALIENLQKLVHIFKRNLLATPLQFPQFWVKNQTDNLTIFAIPHDSKEFKMVEKAFKIHKINKLQRIQNRILFEKYLTEKAYLSEQNGGTVRQLMLFHGTRANSPELIYSDMEESFNINYAKMGSYGKGIYFAKDSSYSNNYRHTSSGKNQMFYCLVLAGCSEVWNGSQTLNTNFKDAAKKIRYESVVDSKTESIVVVFKNRRAYPLYLITY